MGVAVKLADMFRPGAVGARFVQRARRMACGVTPARTFLARSLLAVSVLAGGALADRMLAGGAWLSVSPALATGSPGQPKSGPGGTDYAVAAADIVKKIYGEGNGRAAVFYPKGPADRPRPVVVFVHAPGAISPSWYGAWLEHLVRRGAVVVYPLYEETIGAVRYEDMTAEALKGVRAALAGLAENPGVKADVSALSVVGHSGGAVIAANLAALSGRDELPPVRLLFGAMPDRPGAGKSFGPPLQDLASIPQSAVALMLVGDRDSVAGDRGARQILTAAGHLGQNHRLIARANSDNHGLPAVYFSHHAPVAPDQAWDLAQIPGAAPQGAAGQAAAGGKDGGSHAGAATPKLSPQEVRLHREEQRKRAAALWRVGYEERRGLTNFEGRTVGAANYAIWKLFDLAAETVYAGGDAMTLKRDPRLYDMGQWSDGWPLRRLGVETPKPVVHKEGPEVSQGAAPARSGAPGASSAR